MAASHQSHLNPINFDRNSTCNEQSTFTIFPFLPKELRAEIWWHVLKQNRIIKMRIDARPEIVALRLAEEKGQPTQADTRPGSVSNEERFRVIVFEHQVLSKLLRVNQESRDEALRFFRVRIPCTFIDGNEKEQASGTLHFNPEFDFLQLSPSWPIKDTLIDFLYHLKTNRDPCHAGLLNLAIDFNGLGGHDIDTLQPSDLDEDIRTAVEQSLAHIEEVFFVSSVSVGRQVLSYKSGFGCTEYFYNRSFPVHAMPPTFERLSRDLRPIENDLRTTFTGGGEDVYMVHRWHKILSKFGISAPHIEYRFLLTFVPEYGGEISDKHGAEQWIRRQEERWQAESDGRAQDENPRQLARPVFGFWLFPLNALDSPRSFDNPASSHLRILDLSKHTPELGCTLFTS